MRGALTYTRRSAHLRMAATPTVTLAAAAVFDEVQLDEELDEAAPMVSTSRMMRRVRKKIRKLTPAHLNPTPRGQRRPAGTGKRQHRNVSFIDDTTNFTDDTGLTPALFETLYLRMLPRLAGPRITADGPKKRVIARTWTPMTRLFIVLRWLRHQESYRRLAHAFGGTAATISREIWDVIPKLYVEFKDTLQLPTAEEMANLPHRFRAAGAIDCTAHLRNRVHPWSTEYYRGDLHEHFIAAQLMCALNGKPWDVQLAPGHNNDQGLFNTTGVEEMLETRDERLLADMGYTSDFVVRPDDLGGELRLRHSGFRSVVEQNFALVHMFAASGQKFRGTPELQEMVLMIVYALVFLKCAEQPLRDLRS